MGNQVVMVDAHDLCEALWVQNVCCVVSFQILLAADGCL